MTKLNKLIIYIVIPAILLLFWVFSTISYAKTLGFSVIEYKHTNENKLDGPQGKLMKGDKISGEFRAKENYLGILLVRFKDFTKFTYSGEDVLSFKLKEKGSQDWYFTGSFRSSSLEKNLNYPLGFPIINNSKDKTYYFEITSLNGNNENSVVFDKNNSDLYTRYKFPLETIKDNKSNLKEFVIKKAFASLTNTKFIFNSLLYLLPFLIYVFAVLIRKNKKSDRIFLSVLLLIVLIDIFYIQEIQNTLLIGVFLGYVILIKYFKISEKITFTVAFLFISIWAVTVPLGINHLQDKLNLWTYFFLLIGLTQLIIEERKNFIKNKNK